MSAADVLPLLARIMDRLGAIESKIGTSSVDADSSSSSSSDVQELPRSIRGFDQYCASFLDPFVASCDKLGGEAATLGGLVKEAWKEMRKILLMSTACKEPAPSAYQGLLAGIMTQMKALNDASTKRDEWEKHSKTLKEGCGCLNW